MNIGIKIAIIVISIVVVLAIIGSVVMTRANHHQFCQNWSNNINVEKQDIGNQIFSERLNGEIADYNRQCTY